MTDTTTTDQARIDELQKPVGSVSVLASEESHSPKLDLVMRQYGFLLPAPRPFVARDDDFDDEPLPARTCAIDGEECESCQ